VTQERQEPVFAQPPPPPPPSVPGPNETFKGAQFPPMREPAPQQPKPATETLKGARFAEDNEATDPEGPPKKPARPPSGQHRPSPSRARMQTELEQEDFEDSLRAAGVKKSGKAGWILLLIAGLGLGGGLGYYFGWYLPEQEAKEAEKKVAEKTAADDAKKREDEARVKAEQAKTLTPPVAAVVDAGAPAVVAVVDAGPPPVVDAGAPVVAVVDAGAPVVDAGVPKAPAKVAEPVHDYDWYMARADRLRELEKSAQALDMYGRAAEIHPDRAEPLAGRGLALLDMGNAAAAQASLEQALAINRSYGPAIMGLAEAYRASGTTDKAIQYYQRYLEVLPNGPEAAVARNQLERLKK
jgi:tetratricopeptide (TPR) repeat protein